MQQPHGVDIPVQTSLPMGTYPIVLPNYPGLSYSGVYSAPKPIKYSQRAAQGLGISQIIIGIICLIFNCVLLGYNSIYFSGYTTGHGIWGGTLFFIAGLLALISGSRIPNKCLIIATMVMSILAACATPLVIAFSVLDAVFAEHCKTYLNDYQYRPYDQYYSYNYRCSQYYEPRYTRNSVQFELESLEKGMSACEREMALNIIMATLAFVEATLAIASSALCCKAACCRGVQDAMLVNQPAMFDPNHHRPLPPMAQEHRDVHF